MKRELKVRIWDYELNKMFEPIDISFGVNPLYDRQIMLLYTGLKDKNGKEIYEGDIVDSWAGLKDNNCPYIRIVKWSEKEPALVFDPLTGFNLSKPNEHLFEIIGNIYQNPELLKP